MVASDQQTLFRARGREFYTTEFSVMRLECKSLFNVLLCSINPHEDSSGLNAVGELQTLCLAKHFPAPEYTVIGDEGEPHEKLFTYKCTVSQRSATG